MDQFMTTFLGGYRKDLVDERLKELVGQIEQLRREAKAAGEREDRLREQLEEARRRAETLEAQRGGGEAEARAVALEAELAEARGRLELMESALRRAGRDQERTDQEKRLREELTAALQWSESLESELKLARKEQDIRAHNRILELERTKTLNQRILELEDERRRREGEHQRELARLREQLEQQNKTSAATERILAIAEQEARALVQQAQARAQQMERQMEEDMRAKKLAAAQALEGARNQVIRYLDAFNVTRDKLAATYNELDALVEQIPRPDSPVIELERDGLDENWSYPGSQS
ncbi:MAG: hypothetical protein HFF81_08325 [Oscillospiraceae bacterium]|nr:hypothetical protein [Oscillospiraceae bacterium]